MKNKVEQLASELLYVVELLLAGHYDADWPDCAAMARQVIGRAKGVIESKCPEEEDGQSND